MPGKSVPDSLKFLVGMINRGPSAEETVTETQTTISIAQLVFFNTTTKATNANRTETPLVQEYLLLSQQLYNQLSHLDTRHFVTIECRHLANGCVLQCGCIGLMLFHNLSCLDTIICYINTIGIVPTYAGNVCDALVASCATTG